MSDKELNSDEVDKEEDLMFGYGGKDAKPMDLLADYLPEQEDYGAKTVLTRNQVHMLASLEQLIKFYPELEHREEIITEWIAAYEKRMTSVHGLSRDDFLEILVAMQGGSVDNEKTRGILEKVLDADVGESDD
jgi:hypothetical protein